MNELVTENTRKRQRRSKQREIIVEELRKLKSHPRSDELYTLVRQRLPNISLGTVYRNLNELQREGMALEIYCGDFVRYDGDVSAHDHLLCRMCHRVWDFEDRQGAGDTRTRQFSGKGGFQIEGQYTIFFGTCPQCGARFTDKSDRN